MPRLIHCKSRQVLDIPWTPMDYRRSLRMFTSTYGTKCTHADEQQPAARPQASRPQGTLRAGYSATSARLRALVISCIRHLSPRSSAIECITHVAVSLLLADRKRRLACFGGMVDAESNLSVVLEKDGYKYIWSTTSLRQLTRKHCSHNISQPLLSRTSWSPKSS